jgi:hypothetical protein
MRPDPVCDPAGDGQEPDGSLPPAGRMDYAATVSARLPATFAALRASPSMQAGPRVKAGAA